MGASLDDLAANMADTMLAGDGKLVKGMPMSRGGANGAEGGFTSQAGGTVIDSSAEKASACEDTLDKGEPGRQGPAPKIGDNVTNEPGRQDASNAIPAGDDSTRARKPGRVGGMPDSGADAGKNVSEDEDEQMRKRVKKSASEEEEEPEEEEAEKSMYGTDDLIKSLEVLEAVAQGSSVQAPADRRADLAEKLAAGTLSKSEMSELSDLMKSDQFAEAEDELVEIPEDDFSKSYQEAFADDDTLAEAYEVSPYLERHSQMTAAALDQVQSTLAKSLEDHRDRTSAFNTQLAKSLMGMAQVAKSQDSMIKSLAARLGTVENQPLPRQGVATKAQIMQKSLGPNEVGGHSDQLSKSQVADTLEQMAMKNILKSRSGHRIDMAMASLEQGGAVPRSLLNDVIEFRKNNQ